MNILLRIGGIRFLFDSDLPITVEGSIAPFFFTNEKVIDVNVKVRHDFSAAPRPTEPMIGEDLLMEYYQADGRALCLTKGGQGKYLSCCVSDSAYRDLTCYVDFPSGSAVDTIGNLLRMIPLMRILLQHRVLFFHASQIAVGGTGILFSAPSQTGKTTQARLWERHRGARILCNDRTLTNGVQTYGFPVDGSAPVISGEICALGAITVLEQAPENTVRRLRSREILLRLMPQLVIDTWDPESRAMAVELLLELSSRVPVYLLRCTPDEGAVSCLEQQLRKDGVISYE